MKITYIESDYFQGKHNNKYTDKTSSNWLKNREKS